MQKKILIIGPSWIGDIVMAQVLFKVIKQNEPNSKIHVLAPSWSAPLLERMEEVERVLISPFKHGQLSLYKRYMFGKKLRSQKYNQAIVLPNSFKSALIPFWAKIPKRTGYLGEMRFILLNDIKHLNKKKLPLMIQRFAFLGVKKGKKLHDLPKPRLIFTTDESLKSDPEAKILALCPGAAYGSSKRWPAEYFAEVAQAKLKENWEVWIFGSESDKASASKIQKLTKNKCANFTGKLSLLKTVDLLALADVVITNDTGLMHIAAALDKPLIAIYGSSSPKFTPPLSSKAKILSLNLKCSPCFKRECPRKHLKCLYDINPYIVLKEFVNLFW